MAGLVRVTTAADLAEAITLAEAKVHLKVEETEEHELILAIVAAAREFAETFTRRRLTTQTWDLTLDSFPSEDVESNGGVIELPTPPLQSITSITYIDVNGTTQTLSASLYQVDARTEPGRVMPAWGQSWPSTREVLNAVTVRFVCGFGAAGAVPSPIKAAMLLLIGHLFRNREDEITGTISTPLKMGAERLLRQWKWGSYP